MLSQDTIIVITANVLCMHKKARHMPHLTHSLPCILWQRLHDFVMHTGNFVNLIVNVVAGDSF